MLKQVLDIIILYLLIYLFGAYIIFLVKSLIYGKEKFYGSVKPTLMEKIKKYFFNLKVKNYFRILVSTSYWWNKYEF